MPARREWRRGRGSGARGAQREPDPAVAALFIAAATLVAYAGCFSGEWISDDVQAIAHNPLLRSLDLENLRAMFSSFDDSNYMPLKVLSLAVDHRLWGTRPAGYHLTNLLLHTANAITIFLLLLRLGESRGIALVAALLWAVHPVQVESVAWVSERKNVLSTFFFLLAFHTYLSWSDAPRTPRYALLLVLFAGALLSKINTLVLPAITLAYEVTLRLRFRRRDVVATIPLLTLGAAIAWINLAGNPIHGAEYHGGSLGTTLRTTATVIPRYLGLVVFPPAACTVQSVTLRASWFEPGVMAGVLTLVALGVAAVVLRLRRRPEAFWLVWFGVTLSPMLNVVPFPALMADRYLYLPIVGPLVLLVRGVSALVGRVAARPVAAAAIAISIGLTYARVPVFHDPLSLWADGALRSPYVAADRPFRSKVPRTADLQLLRAALEHDPDSAVLHNAIGAIAFEEGRLPEAVAALERAWAIDPGEAAFALNLGRAYLRADRPNDAVRILEQAAALEPPSYYAQLNLARAYLRLEDPSRARAPLERARRIRRGADDWTPVWHRLQQMEVRAPPAARP